MPAIRALTFPAARRDLGYEPRVAFEQGLAETVRWFQREIRDAPRLAL